MFNQKIQDAWNERCKKVAEEDKFRAEGNKLYAEGDKLFAEGEKLFAEGRKLRAEGDKLFAEGDKLYAEGDKLYAEGSKLFAEGRKLRAEGDILFYDVVISVFGKETNITWSSGNPVINGWEYKEGAQGPSDCDGKVVEIEDKKYKLVEVK